MKQQAIYPITSVRGGISEHGNKGPRGSFKFGYGLDIRSGEDTIKANQKLKKDSSTTVVDLVLAMFRGSDGAIYAFGDTGKVYRKSSGTWTLKHTDSDGKITGAVEFKSTGGSYILYATQTKLKRITLTNAGGTWSGNVDTVGTFTAGSATTLHTMRVGLGAVLVNDGKYIAQYAYDDSVNMTSLTLSSGKLANDLINRGSRMYFGTVGDGAPTGFIIDWDRNADSWISEESVQDDGVKIMMPFESGALVQTGSNGNLRYFNLATITPLKRIPGTANSRPGSSCEYKSIIHFGMEGGTKDGVYSYGRLDKNDPYSLNLEYVPSHGKQTGCSIGALCSDGTDLYVAWKDGSTYGIDVTDQENKAVAVLETLEYNAGRPETDKQYLQIKLTCRSMPASPAAIQIKYKVNGASSWSTDYLKAETDATSPVEGETKMIYNIEDMGESIELRIELTPTGNTTPEIVSINTFYAYDNIL